MARTTSISPTLRPRVGFSLVELVACTGVVTVILSVTVPTIMHARDLARRMQCHQQITQLGLALGVYASTHSVLPPGVVNKKGPIRSKNDEDQLHFSWLTMITPQFDHPEIYRNTDFSASVYARKNKVLRSQRLRLLYCPSDPNNFRQNSSNYAGVHHHKAAPIDVNNSGVLFLNSSVDIYTIPDGAQYTMMIGEKVASLYEIGWYSGTESTLRNIGSGFARSEEETTHEFALNDPALHVPGLQSTHDGIHATFCDGHTRLLSRRTDITLLRQLANRNDGELVSEF